MNRAYYSDLFGKDRPLRHYTQHFCIAAISFIVSRKVFLLPNTISDLIYFLLFSILIDIDGFVSLFTLRHKVPETRLIAQALLDLNLKKAATLATTHHKKLNRLIFHNVFGVIFFIYLLYLALSSKNTFLANALCAILSHFLFDILDDLYQLGHLHNWLWPLEKTLSLLQQRRQI